MRDGIIKQISNQICCYQKLIVVYWPSQKLKFLGLWLNILCNLAEDGGTFPVKPVAQFQSNRTAPLIKVIPPPKKTTSGQKQIGTTIKQR